MPTGYTAELVEKNLTFEQFVWKCCRAMGACIMMRDDAWDARIPERFEPSDYHAKELARAEAQFGKLVGMSGESAKLWGEKEKAKEEKRLQESIKIEKASKQEAIYSETLQKVKEWTPPTPDHYGLKKFMIEQLESSMRFDSHDNYYEEALRTLRAKTPQMIFSEAIAKAKHDIEYHTRENLEEIQRTDSRNRWLAQLRESVPQPK